MSSAQGEFIWKMATKHEGMEAGLRTEEGRTWRQTLPVYKSLATTERADS